MSLNIFKIDNIFKKFVFAILVPPPFGLETRGWELAWNLGKHAAAMQDAIFPVEVQVFPAGVLQTSTKNLII